MEGGGERRGQSNALSEVQARAGVTHTVVALLSPSCSSFASRGEEMCMILQLSRQKRQSCRPLAAAQNETFILCTQRTGVLGPSEQQMISTVCWF